MRKIALTSVLLTGMLCSGFTVVGQVEARIDSLNQRSTALQKVYPDSAFALGKTALDLSRKYNLREKEFASLSTLCTTCYMNQWFDQSLDYCQQAYSFTGIDRSQKTFPYIWHGLSNVHLGRYNDAIKSFLNYVEIAREQGNLPLVADGLSNIGLAYLNDGNILKAAEFYRASLGIKQIDSTCMAYALQNYARVMMSMSKFDSAEYYFNQALLIADRLRNDNVKYWVYAYTGFLPGRSLQQQIELRQKALEIAMKEHLGHEIAATNFGLAELLFKNNDVDGALIHCEQAVRYGRIMNDFDLVLKTYQLAARAMINVGEFEESRAYLSQYEFLKDSLSAHSIQSFESIMGANELVTQEREIEQIRDRLAATEAVNRQNQIALAGAGVATLLIGVILFMTIRANRIKTRTNKELQVLNEKLDAAIKETEVLTGMIVHDIRSPFNKIEMMINVLEMDGDLPEIQKDSMQAIKSVIADSRILTNELLEINQIESGTFEKRFDEIDIKPFICSLLPEFKSLAEKKQIDLTITEGYSQEALISDKYALNRIIENLVSNAIKYTPKGGKVELGFRLTDGRFDFTVRDNGPGISDEEQSLLFKKFSRTSAIPSGDESSTGLGLYIVYKLTESLNGLVSVNSSQGHGAEFRVCLPASDDKMRSS